MSEELRPCRYCGRMPDTNSRHTHVWCVSGRDKCPYSRVSMYPKEWNSRPIEDAQRGHLARKDEEIATVLARAEKAEADKSMLFDEALRQKKRAIKAEAERDVLAEQLELNCGHSKNKWLRHAAWETAKRVEAYR